MERRVLGYILVFVCVMLTLNICFVIHDVIVLHLELNLIDASLSDDTKLYNARFLYMISPENLDEFSEWKSAVIEKLADENSENTSFIDLDDEKENSESLEPPEKIILTEDEENLTGALLLLEVIVLLLIGVGTHFISRFLITPSWANILPLTFTPALGVGMGFIALFAFFFAGLFGFLGAFDTLFIYAGPIIGNVVVLLLVNRYMKSNGTTVWRETGLVGCNYRKAILVGLAGYFAFFPLQIIINTQGTVMSYFLGFLPSSHPFVDDFVETSSAEIKIIIAILVIFSAPFFEEIFFRGIFLQSLEQRFHPFIACLFTGIVFGIVHANFISIFLISFLGIYMAFLMQKTRSVITPIVIHFMFNASALYQLLAK